MDLERQLKELRWSTLCPSCCVLRGTAQSYLLAEKWQPSEQELGLKGQNKESSCRGESKLVKTCKCEMFTTFMLSCFSRSCDVPEISACVSYLSDLGKNLTLSKPSAAIFWDTHVFPRFSSHLHGKRKFESKLNYLQIYNSLSRISNIFLALWIDTQSQTISNYG